MAKAKKSKQLSFSMRNRVGLLSEISTAITNVKVGMNAICAYGMEGKAYFMMVTDSNATRSVIRLLMPPLLAYVIWLEILPFCER